jgi:hypothetical protein
MVSVFYFKLQYYVPDTIQYYITVPYSMLFFCFLFFVLFLYHTQTQNVGGHMLYWDTRLWGRRGVGNGVE